MIVAVIHQRDALAGIHRGVAQGILRAAHGVGFHANAEHLRLHAGLHLVKVKGLGQDLVHGLLVAHAGTHAVGGNILEAVAGPDVHDAGLAQLLGQVLADADAGLAMLDPEAAGLLIGRGQGQRVALGVREEGGVEVAAQAALLAEIHPLLEVLGLDLVTIHPAAVLLIEDGVAGMEVHLLGAGAQLHHHVQVGHQLFGGAGAAGIVAGGLDAAGQGRVGVAIKAAHVVALPAVQAHGRLAELFHGSVHVHADGGVAFLGILKGSHDASSFLAADLFRRLGCICVGAYSPREAV